MSELPWIISVDDHVVEPPTVWTDRLPARDRERGPHVVQDTCATTNDPKTLRVNYTKGGDGPLIDWWVYEDLAKVVPKVVACAGIPVEEHTTDPIAYRDMRPGCYDPVARLADMDVNRTERSLCFPVHHPLLRPDVPGSKGQSPRRPVRDRLQRLDDRRVVRRLRRAACCRSA